MDILIAEDARDQRLLLSRVLEKKGHKVFLAEDGRQALEVLQQNSTIQLIISDWMMPDIDGPELCKRVREHYTERYIYFILLTGKQENSAVIEGLSIGADDFLRKPVNFAELEARLKAGKRVLQLEKNLADRNAKLEHVLHAMEQDLQSANTLLTGLLPKPCSDDLISFNWRFHPSKILGGDMIGYQPINAEHIAFYQIDVSGHGVPSALFSFSLHNLLSDIHSDSSFFLEGNAPISGSSQAFDGIRSPEKVLSMLNQRFQSSIDNMMYFSIVCGVIHIPSGQLQVAQAGHPPPLLLKKQCNQEVDLIKGRGVPIGFVTDFPYISEKIQLNPGDAIFCYTDGLTESLNTQQELFGCVRLQEILQKNMKQSDACLLDGVLESVIDWQGNDCFEDDISYMLVTWKGTN